jgi:hypothetical protein
MRRKYKHRRNPLSLSDLKKGDRVVLARVNKDAYRGKHGTVLRTIKKRNEVDVLVDGFDPHYSASRYGASIENVDKIARNPRYRRRNPYCLEWQTPGSSEWSGARAYGHRGWQRKRMAKATKRAFERAKPAYRYRVVQCNPRRRNPDFGAALAAWLNKANAVVAKDRSGVTLTAQKGGRYVKILENEAGRVRSVFAFIDKNGDILKPSSWKQPAKHARGNIFDEHGGTKSVDAYGPAYLRNNPRKKRKSGKRRK